MHVRFPFVCCLHLVRWSIFDLLCRMQGIEVCKRFFSRFRNRLLSFIGRKLARQFPAVTVRRKLSWTDNTILMFARKCLHEEIANTCQIANQVRRRDIPAICAKPSAPVQSELKVWHISSWHCPKSSQVHCESSQNVKRDSILDIHHTIASDMKSEHKGVGSEAYGWELVAKEITSLESAYLLSELNFREASALLALLFSASVLKPFGSDSISLLSLDPRTWSDGIVSFSAEAEVSSWMTSSPA